MKIAALILAGGKSSRMGTDKGLLKKYGNYWVELIQESLPVGTEYFISVGSHNFQAYEKAGFNKLILDKTELEEYAGPIKGVLSGLDTFMSYDKLLVIPCDMINLKTEHLEMMLDQKSTSCFFVNGKMEPLPFCLDSIAIQSLSKTDNKNISLHTFLENNSCHSIEIMDQTSFNNYNTVKDLEQ